MVIAAVAWFLFGRSSPKKLAVTGGPRVTTSPQAVAGRWSPGPGSVAGYRVREKLAQLPSNDDAVGRSSVVTGELTLVQAGQGATATDAHFEADVTQLKSDQSRRDNFIRTRGLESDRFPMATFRSTAPVTVAPQALSGQVVRVDVPGDLTIHGQTRRVTIPVDAQLKGIQIELVGSLTFPFSDFGMQPPSIGGFVSVESNATLEVRLELARA